ncbi:YaaC family protein [Paraburkholderia sediminicola]|uniref:YaaC family protein n=1 Tax=Paraburkholderia sediminicola TaxID=458836 RepID=UPI0038BC213F
MKSEHIFADNLSEVVWLRLKRLSSHQLCAKVILGRTSTMPDASLTEKATGMAWAIRSAVGYWETKSGGLNSRVLSRYYALLQISIAEQIASGDERCTLPAIQRHTEQGHGLFTVAADTGDFPSSYLVGCLKSGHFPSYCKARGMDLKKFAFERRLRERPNEVERAHMVSLADLLRRVPELQNVTQEYMGMHPLSFHLAKQPSSDLEQQFDQMGMSMIGSIYDAKTLTPALKTTSAIAICPVGYQLTAEQANSLDLPIRDFEDKKNSLSGLTLPTGQLEHSAQEHWYEGLRLHESGYCGSSIMVPYWGLEDVFTLHLVILYAFSIVTRYLPSLWHEIEDGKLDHLRSLLEHYLVVVDNVLPRIALERMTGDSVHAKQSGSVFSLT